MTNKKTFKNNTPIGNNIVKDNLVTMINNGDINYKASPCVVMNNLVKDHNNYVDEMCTSSNDNINENPKFKINFKNTTSSLISNSSSLNPSVQDEVKTFNDPVDYETAFSEYYPKNKKNSPNDDEEDYSNTYPHRPENKLNTSNFN